MHDFSPAVQEEDNLLSLLTTSTARLQRTQPHAHIQRELNRTKISDQEYVPRDNPFSPEVHAIEHHTERSFELQ